MCPPVVGARVGGLRDSNDSLIFCTRNITRYEITQKKLQKWMFRLRTIEPLKLSLTSMRVIWKCKTNV